MSPRVSEAARIFAVAAFLVLIAQGPTFSGHTSQLAAAGQTCTQTMTKEGGMQTTCTNDAAKKEATIDPKTGKTEVKEDANDPCNSKNQGTKTWTDNKCDAKNGKEQATGSTKVTTPGGETEISCKPGEKCGMVVDGNGGGSGVSAASQYTDSKPYIAQVPITPPSSETTAAMNRAFPGVADGTVKLAYPVTPSGQETSNTDGSSSPAPVSPVPGTTLDNSQPVNLNPNLSQNVSALSPAPSAAELQAVRSYLPPSGGSTLGINGVTVAQAPTALFSGIQTPVGGFPGTVSAASIFSDQSISLGAQPGVATQNLNIAVPSEVGAFTGTQLQEMGFKGVDPKQTYGFVTIPANTAFLDKSGSTVTAGEIAGGVGSRLSSSELLSRVDPTTELTMQYTRADGQEKNVTASAQEIFTKFEQAGVSESAQSRIVNPVTPDSTIIVGASSLTDKQLADQARQDLNHDGSVTVVKVGDTAFAYPAQNPFRPDFVYTVSDKTTLEDKGAVVAQAVERDGASPAVVEDVRIAVNSVADDRASQQTFAEKAMDMVSGGQVIQKVYVGDQKQFQVSAVFETPSPANSAPATGGQSEQVATIDIPDRPQVGTPYTTPDAAPSPKLADASVPPPTTVEPVVPAKSAPAGASSDSGGNQSGQPSPAAPVVADAEPVPKATNRNLAALTTDLPSSWAVPMSGIGNKNIVEDAPAGAALATMPASNTGGAQGSYASPAPKAVAETPSGSTPITVMPTVSQLAQAPTQLVKTLATNDAPSTARQPQGSGSGPTPSNQAVAQGQSSEQTPDACAGKTGRELFTCKFGPAMGLGGPKQAPPANLVTYEDGTNWPSKSNPTERASLADAINNPLGMKPKQEFIDAVKKAQLNDQAKALQVPTNPNNLSYQPLNSKADAVTAYMAKLYYQSDYANCKTWGCVVSSYVGDDSQNGKANQASHIARSGMSANTPVPASNDTNGWVKWMQGATRAEYGSAGVQMLSEADIRKGVAQFNNGTPSQAQSQTQTAPAAQPTTQQIRSDLITSANALDTPANRANGWQKLRQVTLQSALVGASYKVRDQQPISPAEQDALKPYLPGDTKFTNGVIPNKAEAEKAYSQLDRYISHEKDNWCAGTAATILEKVAPQVPHYVYADDFYKDYKQNNAYHPKGDGYTPQPMDAFWIAKANPQPETPLGEGYTRRDANGALQPGRSQVTGHVGFILSYNPATGMVHTREGNNNGQYGEFDRPLSSIMGFGDTAKYLQAKGATPAAANATAASAAAQAAPSGAFRAASVPGQKPVASPTSASLQKDAGLQISVCVGTAKCGDGIQFNSRNYINPLCQKDLGCTASASELAGVPDAKYPEQAFKDPLSSQAQQYYQQQVERAAQNASQGRVLIDNCNNVDYAVCKTILDKLQAWNQQHPAQPVKAWINNAHFETDTNTLPLWSHPVAGGATVEQDIENPQESSPAYLDKRRQEAGVPGLPILFAGSEQYAAEVQRQIQQGGYPGMGTSGSKVGDGPNGFKTTDTTSAISGQAGPNTPVGAMQRFAQTAPAFVFGRSGADGKPELLDPKTAAQAQAKGEKLDVYENVKPLPFRAQQYTKVGDQYYQRAGTVDEYAARQTAGAQAALQNGAYAQQLGSKMDKPVMIEGQGSTRPVYGLNADGSKGDPLGTLKTMSKEQVQLLNAAQKLGVELKECDAGYCTKDGKLAELRAENGGKPGDAPRTVGGVSGQNRRVWNPNVQARTPTTEERVGALKAAGVKVVDNRGAGAYPARSGAIVGEFVHGDLASGEKLVSYCAQTRKCYNDIVMEDGTVVMMGGTDKAPFHAFGAADYTNGIVVAGADGGRSATPAQLETVRKILSVDMDQFGWWVTTHGESAANSIGGRNINEAGPNVRAMIFDGGIPAGDQQLGLYLSDPANPNDRGTRFGDVFNASSLPPARESATFTSTDGKTIVGLDPVGDVGKATASLTTDSDGNLGVNYNYEAPKPPETPDTRSPIEKIRDAAADAQTKMRDMWKNMFGGGQQPGGQQGGGGAQPANNAVPANNSRPAGGAAQPSNSGTPAPAPARTGQQPATTANGASGSQTPVVSVSGGNTATGISGERFTCSPGTVVNGSTATPLTIAWTCPAGTTSIGTGFSTLGTNSGSVQLVVSTTSASVNYQLTCQGAQASQTLSCAVQVRHPRVTLVAKPASVESGAPVQLQWSAFDVTSCSLYAPPTVLLVSGGTQGTANTLPLSRSSVFSALCNVSSATTTASVTVLVKGDTATPLQTVLPR